MKIYVICIKNTWKLYYLMYENMKILNEMAI